MLGRTIQLELPQRVVVYYLLFCLVSTVWLAVGVAYISHAVLDARSENATHALLGKAAHAAAIEYLRGGSAGLQPLAARVQREGSLAYCAIISPERIVLAHSDATQVGQPVQQRTGDSSRFGTIEEFRFTDEHGRRLVEYRSELRSRDELIGSLRLATVEVSIWGTLLAIAERVPIAIVGPLALMLAGGVVLHRNVRSTSLIESQLRKVAAASSLREYRWSAVPVRSAAAFGWNRIVEEFQQSPSEQHLDERLFEAVRSVQSVRLQEALDSLTDGVGVTDHEGRLTLVNDALISLLGCKGTKERWLGREIRDCLGDGAESEAALFDPAHEDRAVIQELPRKFADGQRILRVAKHPWRSGGDGANHGHVWSVRDITQSKLAEKMLNEFIDSATHELRTPLANLRAYAETLSLSEVLEVEQQKEFCNIISSEATRLARLIDDLLDISSMQVGSLAIARQHVEVARLLQDVCTKVRPQMDQKNLSFEMRLSEKLPEMQLDKDKFAAALVNLLGNAAKYTPAGGSVTFRAEVVDGRLMLEVEDTGMGIAEDEVGRVFEKFFRSSNSQVQAETGSGLGLSLVQEVVRLHGGDISVTSQLGEGSKFTVKVPIK